MKRVLSIATLYPNSHQPRFGTFVARQLEALAARGDWDVTVINPIGLPPFAPGPYRPLVAAAVDGVEHGVRVYRPRFLLVPRLGGPINPAMIARAVLPLARRLHAAAPFDVVDAQFFYPDGPAAARIAAALGLPLSIKARGADISHWGQRGYARSAMARAAEQAAGLLSVSAALADDMAAIGLPREKITLHYTGLDRTLFHPQDRAASRAQLRQSLGLILPDGAPLIATVGALIPRKGQALVLAALEQLPGVHLALVGAGPDKQALVSQAQAKGLADRVHFLGSIDHHLLPVVLSAANAMVLPSASEGLANAWVEALACGCPLVISDAGGAKELVISPKAGRIVARNADAIAAAVTAVLADPLPQAEVAEMAAPFSWEANGAALAEYYEGLTNR
ncbi:glycosyltransferase [Altererythrobacter xixiisoli]|uniref:Glycosyltransferase n=1 Tax=Croceibacterium xixiisoli TaxID=1476466 RepID=A0A6I4TVP0_9SPHN|nr:glycosyltransferase [Croceibacterium xixiisoli]MXO98658.1 glycosyltransferase [Croceibacterium xixiisoli]